MFAQYLNLAERRYSCRDYLAEPVSRHDVASLLEAARLAPSACNRQPWTFMVVDTPRLHAAVAACYKRQWFAAAPVYIIALAHTDEAWVRPDDGKRHSDIDLAIATEHICLAATAHGLATCWICNFDPTALREALSLPETIEPVAILSLGWPAKESEIPSKTRKTLDQIVTWAED